MPEGPSEASPSGEGEAVALLLSQADAQMARLALTTPEGDNAYETYQRILSLEPENEAAREGLRSIGIRYVSLADRARSRGDRERARRYVDKACLLYTSDAADD